MKEIELSIQLLTVTLLRLYDVTSAILNKIDPETWEYLSELHERGKLHNGPPFVDDPFDKDDD